MKKRKKITKRSRSRFPALEPQLNLRSRYDLIDYDYVDKLSKEDKEFLNSFTEEYVNANLKHKGKKLHKTKKLKKDRYDANNARNRCIMTKAKASGKLDYSEDIQDKLDSLNTRFQNPEEHLLFKEEIQELIQNFNDLKDSED